MSPTNSNNPSQVHLVFQASNDRGVLQQAVPVQQSHMSPIPVELERRMLQQPMHAQRSPFPPMPMPIYSYNSPVFHMPTISQQPMPMHPWPMSPMPAQQAPTENAYLENAKKKMLDDPSNDQIQTFQQRAWSSKKMQIDLHEWVGEMRKKPWIDNEQEETLCHSIHRRDHDIIKTIIDIRDYADTMTDKAPCLTWADSSERPATGTEMQNELLAAALKERERERRLFPQALLFPFGYLKFSPEEWSYFQVTEETKRDSYITIVTLNSNNRYLYNFKPADMEFMQQMLKYACSNALQPAQTFQVQLPANACKGQVLRLKVPHGLPCAGQETAFTLPEGVKGGQIINVPVKGGQIINVPCEPDGKPFLSARLRFKRTCRKKSAHILQVPCKKEEDIFNVQLVRYFVENVWKLERPDVIISVTGGADNFDLPPEQNAMLMRGMMEGTRKLKTWSVPIYGCISFLSVCGYCVVHACCVRACCVRLCQRAPAAAND